MHTNISSCKNCDKTVLQEDTCKCEVCYEIVCLSCAQVMDDSYVCMSCADTMDYYDNEI